MKQAQQASAPATPPSAPLETSKAIKTETKQPIQKITKANTSLNKFKSFEWMVENSSGNKSTLRDLKKVQIKSLNAFLQGAETLDKKDCAQLLGIYKGSVKDINENYFGSLEFELKNGPNTGKDELLGKLAWYSEANINSFSEKIKNNCGKKNKDLSGRIFNVAADKYVQIYKLNNLEKIAGNFYEILPNGTSKILGSFILKRVDRF